MTCLAGKRALLSLQDIKPAKTLFHDYQLVCVVACEEGLGAVDDYHHHVHVRDAALQMKVEPDPKTPGKYIQRAPTAEEVNSNTPFRAPWMVHGGFFSLLLHKGRPLLFGPSGCTI